MRSKPSRNLTFNVGDKFNRLTIKELSVSRNPSNKIQHLCLCDCGNEWVAVGAQLRNGNTKSCGCLKLEMLMERNRGNSLGQTHGYSKHYLYRTWVMMVKRCHDSTWKDYKHYGLRGIEVQCSWRDEPNNFIKWVDVNLGIRPNGSTLDRIDNNKGYSEGNLRWATHKQQRSNRRDSTKYEDANEFIPE